MSFLKIGDRAAGAIKSGGTTRRAAKMVVVDIDHPDIEDYIDWKVKEEQKVASLVTGSKIVMKAPERHHEGLRELRRPTTTTASTRPRTQRSSAIKAAKGHVPETYIKRVHPVRAQGYTDIEFKTYDTDWDSEAYLTVSGQNSNNSVASPTTS
jgi:ribonucleoside-diphosphate reductase alpha chain